MYLISDNNISIVRPDILPEVKQTYIQPVSQTIYTVTGEKTPTQGEEILT